MALKSGEVYIFEVKYDSELEEMELVELYHKDGFGEIVDIECKFGQGNSQAHLVCIKYVVLTDRISKGALLPLSSLLLF